MTPPSRFRRSRFRVADARDGAGRCRSGFPRRLAIGARFESGDQTVRLSFSHHFNMGSGGGAIRRVAVYLRHGCFVADRADYCRAVKHRDRGLSDRTGSALDSTATDFVDRNAGRNSQRHPRVCGEYSS